MQPLDETDRRILNQIQSHFPLAARPYEVVGKALDLTESEVIARVAALKASGIIRRIGGNFVPGRVGFVSTLCAARVPTDQIESFSRVVNAYPGVTHNYQRDNHFNVWFTFIAPSMACIEANLAQISRETGITDILNLPATKVFKIKAQFDL